jgi:hypothetical protein
MHFYSTTMNVYNHKMPYYETDTMHTRNNGVWYYQSDYKYSLHISYRNNKSNNDRKSAFKSKIFSLFPFNSGLKQ